MNIYGGLSLGVAAPVSKVSAEPASPSGMSGVAYSSGSTNTAPKKEVDTAPTKEDNGFYLPSFDDNGTPHWKEQKVEPENTVDIALPGFDDNGNPHWEEHKVSTEGAEQKQLDVGKLLEGTHNEGYKLYSDGEGGYTQDPNSKGGIYYGENALAPKSTAPKSKKQTATAALPEVSQIYTMNGDDYSIDNTAFANAQRGTGEDQAAASIAGGSGGGSKRNSNVNDAIFGGESNKATPGYSLW